jgi:F420-0:gamma-glutamyl ligase
MRSPVFRHRPYWNADEVARRFAAACRGEVEESMFFWRAVNAEIWMRLYIDSQTMSLDERSELHGFVQRGDEAAAATLDDGPALVAAGRANWARHVFIEDGDTVWARLPLRSELLTPGSDLVAALERSLADLARGGVTPLDGDVLLVSEKALAICQGRSYPIEDIATTPLARTLSRFVSRMPTGVGLAHPTTMQLALDEAGPARILLAAAAAAVTRPFGVRGVFYRVAGAGVNAIDGPSALNLPPYDRWATKAPLDPQGAAAHIAAAISEHTGRRLAVAIIDASDLGAEVFALAGPVKREDVLAVVADNPLGQSDEQTPFGLVRRTTAVAASAPAQVAAAV